MEKGAWQATVYGVAKSWTWLSAHTHTHTHTHRAKSRSSFKSCFSENHPTLNFKSVKF